MSIDGSSELTNNPDLENVSLKKYIETTIRRSIPIEDGWNLLADLLEEEKVHTLSTIKVEESDKPGLVHILHRKSPDYEEYPPAVYRSALNDTEIGTIQAPLESLERPDEGFYLEVVNADYYNEQNHLDNRVEVSDELIKDSIGQTIYFTQDNGLDEVQKTLSNYFDVAQKGDNFVVAYNITQPTTETNKV